MTDKSLFRKRLFRQHLVMTANCCPFKHIAKLKSPFVGKGNGQVGRKHWEGMRSGAAEEQVSNGMASADDILSTPLNLPLISEWGMSPA